MSLENLHQGCSIGHMLCRSIQKYASRIAVVMGDESITYKELGKSAARMVAVFKDYGLGRGDGLAIMARNRIEVVVAYYAAAFLGIRVTPLSVMMSADDVLFILKDSQVKAVIVDDACDENRRQILSDEAEELEIVFSLCQSGNSIDLTQKMASASCIRLTPESSAEDIAFVAYTGGTTGRPKGVVHSNATLTASISLMMTEWEWPAHIEMAVPTPVSHAGGVMIYPVHLQGGTIHLLSGFETAGFLDYVEQKRITATFLVPTLIYLLIEEQKSKPRDMGSLSLVLYGAAPMLLPKLIEALETFGPVFAQLYGQSEAPLCISYLGKHQHKYLDDAQLASCGVPVSNIQVALVDDNNSSVDEGQPGEICIRGPHVMMGYWNRTSETESAFSDGWLHTGDIGRFDDDGLLYIVDRKKDMIISGGFNVFPSEVEKVLQEHPSVSASSVVGVPDERWGEMVVAFVIVESGESIDDNELVNHVKALKGSVQAPKRVFTVEGFPLTPLGKVDKNALRKIAIDRCS